MCPTPSQVIKLQEIIQKQQQQQTVDQAGGSKAKTVTVMGAVTRGGQVVRQDSNMRSVTQAELKQQQEVGKEHCTVQYSTIQYNNTTIQYSTIQYNTVQCNTIQYNVR